MTDKTTELIAEARTWPRDGVNEGPLINALADALEAEHQRADHGWSMVYIERENVRIEYERRTAVEAERDALHAAIRDTPQREYPLMEISAYQRAKNLRADILSRAIDTKEEMK